MAKANSRRFLSLQIGDISMLQLSEVSIRNYRSCRDLVGVELTDFTVFVGRNNVGKSNAMRAIQWLLRRRTLTESDFFDPACPITVEAKIAGVDQSVLAILAREHADRIKRFLRDGVIHVRRIQPAPGCPAAQVKLWFRDQATPESDENSWVENPAGIDNAVMGLFPEPIYIDAMEDAARDVSRADSGSTIGQLIALLLQGMTQDRRLEIQRCLDDLGEILGTGGPSRSPHLAAFDSAANESLGRFFPGITIRVSVPPPDISAVLKSGTIRVFEDAGPPRSSAEGVDVVSLGHGAQRAIQMALVCLLAKMDVGLGAGRTVLMIDEPEIYMHPQAIARVRRALQTLSRSGYQVICSTHSPILIGHDEVRDAVVFAKDNDGRTFRRRQARQELRKVTRQSARHFNDLMGFDTAKELLFADRVVLVEGRTDLAVIQHIFHARHGVGADEVMVGFIATGGVDHLFLQLVALRSLGVDGKAIVDLDFAFRGAIHANLLADDDADLVEARAGVRGVAKAAGVIWDGRGSLPVAVRSCWASGRHAFPEAAAAITRLHDRFRDHGIWLWTRGAIEDHLGVEKGSEAQCRSALENVRSIGIQSVADPVGMTGCVEWIANGMLAADSRDSVSS